FRAPEAEPGNPPHPSRPSADPPSPRWGEEQARRSLLFFSPSGRRWPEGPDEGIASAKGTLMATLALSLAGQFVGGMVGGPIGATIGRALGALAGSAVDGMLFGEQRAPGGG